MTHTLLLANNSTLARLVKRFFKKKINTDASLTPFVFLKPLQQPFKQEQSAAEKHRSASKRFIILFFIYIFSNNVNIKKHGFTFKFRL
jgi:hypothetical protein